jgi:hypothetical protein
MSLPATHCLKSCLPFRRLPLRFQLEGALSSLPGAHLPLRAPFFSALQSNICFFIPFPHFRDSRARTATLARESHGGAGTESASRETAKSAGYCVTLREAKLGAKAAAFRETGWRSPPRRFSAPRCGTEPPFQSQQIAKNLGHLPL